MECGIKHRTNLITDYLSGELSEKEMADFEEHYFKCEICFNELRTAEDAINLIEQEGPALIAAEYPLKNKKFKRPFFNWPKPFRWGLAFSFAAAVIIILIYTLPNRNESQNGNSITINKDTLSEKENIKEKDIINKNEDIADLSGPNFKPEPYMEEWISENIRSSGKIDSILSPNLGEKFHNESVAFQWVMNKDENTALKILTNNEVEIFFAPGNKAQFPKFKISVPKNTFKNSGLYYWRIENETEVLFVGKFYFFK